MRTVLLRVTLALCLLTPCLSQAQLLFYRGLMKTDHLGDSGESKQTYRAWILLDRDTGNMAKINYFSAAGFKLYTVEEYPGLQISTVTGTRGATNSLLTLAESSLDASNRLMVTSIFLQGANRRLTTKRGSTISFPSTLSWVSRGVEPSTRTALSTSWSETGAAAYDSGESTTSNNRGETLAEAEARLVTEFQNKGYQEFLLR